MINYIKYISFKRRRLEKMVLMNVIHNRIKQMKEELFNL